MASTFVPCTACVGLSVSRLCNDCHASYCEVVEAKYRETLGEVNEAHEDLRKAKERVQKAEAKFRKLLVRYREILDEDETEAVWTVRRRAQGGKRQ